MTRALKLILWIFWLPIACAAFCILNVWDFSQVFPWEDDQETKLRKTGI